MERRYLPKQTCDFTACANKLGEAPFSWHNMFFCTFQCQVGARALLQGQPYQGQGFLVRHYEEYLKNVPVEQLGVVPWNAVFKGRVIADNR